MYKELFGKPVNRRGLLRGAAYGFGLFGLSDLLGDRTALAAAAQNPMAPRAPHFAPRAKRVIFLFMHGGPSSIDIFDPKPRLYRDHGKPLPIKRPLAFDDEHAADPLMKPLWDFHPGGKSGIPVSDLFPELRDVVDELCIIRSMVGEGVDHGAALLQTFTGGGVKAGFVYGATDDIGYHAVEDRMHIHDFHATVLRLLGMDHEKLTHRSSGRDFRLTDVAGVVAEKILV